MSAQRPRRRQKAVGDTYRLGPDGEPVPCTYEEWARGEGGEQLGDDLGPNGERVSTVFLGVEHPGGMLFETMVFGGPFDGEQVRYRTRAEAVVGHERMVERVRRSK